MSAAIHLRDDFAASELQQLAKASRDAGQSRRLLAPAEIYDVGSRTDAAGFGAVGFQTVLDWVLAFNACGPDELIDDKAPGARRHRGARPRSGPERRGALAAQGSGHLDPG